MSRRWSEARSLVVALVLFPAPAPTLADDVLIKTLSKDGEVVIAKVEMSTDGTTWTTVEGQSVPGAGTTIFVDKCDGHVRFRAYKIDTMGIFTREKPNDLRYCKTPEVVFNDYVLAVAWNIMSPDKLGDQQAWIAALGGDETAKLNGPAYARKFADALQAKDFGYVAIASSEIAASLRNAKKFDAAAAFSALSYQSTLTGIANAKGATDDPTKFLVAVPGSDLPVLSPDAVDFLKAYQQNNLGITAESPEYGKTGWTTMKSIAAEKIDTSKWKLDGGAIGNFDAKVFAPVGG